MYSINILLYKTNKNLHKKFGEANKGKFLNLFKKSNFT